ncbi:uncharacterized protein K02A2.6-like [Saccostrea cucullata]|uniref:uncharacterized protein K02A2.6-like n=1 Tax=Saccostrea cuccullata TaxID=36930 RepID=UPI002ED14FD5
MELCGIPPPTMDWSSSNLPEAWKKFEQHVKLIFAGPLKEKNEEEQVSYLLLWIGEKGRDIYNTFPAFSNDDMKKLQPHYDRFLRYVQPKLNPIFARYKFNNEVQGTNTFDQFVTKLKLLARDCNFSDAEEMIRDRIVFGIQSEKIREKLINVGEALTLDKAVQIAQAYEYSQEQLKLMGQQSVHVQALSKSTPHAHSPAERSGRRPPHQTKTRSTPPKTPTKFPSTPKTKPCGKCGKRHGTQDTCPAQGQRCNNCHKWNHFASVCRSRSVNDINHVNSSDCLQKPSEMNNVNRESDNTYTQRSVDINHDTCNVIGNFVHESDSDFNIDNVDSNVEHDQAFINIKLGPNHKEVRFKVDTGSQVNILPESLYIDLAPYHTLGKSKIKLFAYNGHSVHPIGYSVIQSNLKGKDYSIEYQVVQTHSHPILGLRACLDLGIVHLTYSIDKVMPFSKSHVLSQYSDVFHGIGLFAGECTFQVDPNVRPVVNPPRKVPVALRDKLKVELDRMESAQIITKVTEPTEWVNSLVVTTKPASGKLRVCLDPMELNKAIMRPHYPMRTLDDILPQVSGAKYFSKLDASSGYWTVGLSRESSLLTTFNTPFGRYRYLRLPFGLKNSQDIFQQKIDQCFEGMSGVAAIVDDILVYGRTPQEHNDNLIKVLDKCRSVGIKMNKEKLQVGVQEVEYFGHILSADGLKPDPSKVAAIRDMEPPSNKSELQTIMGMITYLSKFAPNLANTTSPLRQLLLKDTEFIWDTPQAQAFQKVKDLITRTPGPLLTYFDPGKPVVLETDASQFGLGATLLQDGKPVAFASKSLTPAEIKYAQIEKEMLSILFGCKKFHQYLYGREVQVHTDHKPLVAIHAKPLAQAPARLQRMLLQLQAYDLKLTHIPGKDIPIADTLSRKFLPDTYPQLTAGMDLHVHTVMSSTRMSDRRLEEVRLATQADPQMKILMNIIHDGWPDKRKKCPSQALEYWNHRDELTEIDGILFKGHKIIIPRDLRRQMMEAVHIGHMGVEKCLRRARDIIFWPRMSADITNMVLECGVCLERRNSNTKEPLVSHDIPDYPWEAIATDLFTWNNQEYLLVVDYYSRYFEVEKLHKTTSQAVIEKMKKMFSRLGIPRKVVSDNGPQYASQDFSTFAQDYDFNHVTSSPKYPQSNGLAEKTVQIAKRILDKSKADGKDYNLGLLEYRTTPLSLGYSPAQLLMSRKLRSILPVVPDELKPKVPVRVKELMVAEREKQKGYYDRSAKPLPPLSVGDSIRYQEGKLWKQGIVTKEEGDRSYTVKSTEGAVYRRNRRHLIKSKEKFKPDVSDSNIVNFTEPSTSPPIPTTATSLPNPVEPISEPATEAKHDPPASCNPSPYITRYGRIVKPKVIVSM